MAYPDADAARVTDGSQVRFVDTAEFLELADEVTGRDLGWFFAVYLREPALPELLAEERDGALDLTWVVPEGRVFPLPVPVAVDGEVVVVEMPGGAGSLPLPAGSSYAIDPEDWVLRAPPSEEDASPADG